MAGTHEERVARIASRGIGPAIATAHDVEMKIRSAEWHLYRLVDIGEAMRQIDASRRNVGDDAVVDALNSMIDRPVQDGIDAADRARHALGLLAARHTTQEVGS